MENCIYINESDISPDLICGICSKPFVNPVSLPSPCEKTFCRQCIQSNIEDHRNHCSSCQEKHLTNEHFQSESPTLKRILGKLLLQCSSCQQTNILRAEFEEHSKEFCPKRIVSCLAKDIKCQWIGNFDQLDEHTKNCSYQFIRQDLTGLIQQNELLEQTQTQFEDLEKQLEKMKRIYQNLDKQRNLFEQTEQRIKQFNKSSIEQNKSIEQQNEQIKLLEQENEDLNKRLEIYLTEIKELKEQKNCLNEHFIQSKEIEKENSSLKKQVQDNSTEINRLNEQNKSFEEEILRLKSIEDQKKISIEEINYYKTNNKQITNQLNILQQSYRDQFQSATHLKSENEQLGKHLEYQSKRIVLLEKENGQLINNYQNYFQLSKEQKNRLDQFEEQILDQQFEIEFKNIQIKQIQPMKLFQGKYFSSSLINKSLEMNNQTLNRNEKLRELIDQYPLNSLINLTDEQINDEQMDIIIHNGLIGKKAHSIILSNNSLSTNSIFKLCVSLTFNENLFQLNLSNNHLSNFSIKYLFKCFKEKNQNLKELILRNNQIGDQSFISFSNLFQSNENFITIGFEENEISDQSIEYFSQILSSSNNSIENLSFSNNPLITDLSIQSFTNIIRKKHPLKSLSIENCQISEEGKKQIEQSIPSDLHLSLRL